MYKNFTFDKYPMEMYDYIQEHKYVILYNNNT